MSTTGQSILILSLLVLNLIIAVAYYVICVVIKLHTEKSIIIKAVVIAICPIVAPVVFGLSYFLFRVFMSAPVDLEDVIFGKEHPKFEMKAEEDKEKNEKDA